MSGRLIAGGRPPGGSGIVSRASLLGLRPAIPSGYYAIRLSLKTSAENGLPGNKVKSMQHAARAALLGWVSSLSFFSTAPAEEVRVLEGLTYAAHGGEDLKLDLALPAGEGPFPAVLFIHGGGWAFGNRQFYAPAIRSLARHGFAAATASYRFAPRHPWPAQLEDVRAALRWLRVRAADFAIDTRRIGAGGASAGGHLSLFLGLLPESGGDDARIEAVVNYFGPTDMVEDHFNDQVDGLLRNLAGGTRAELPAIYKDFSPLSHISPGDAPVLTFQGTRDELVPVDQARVLHAALDRARVPNRLDILDGKGHGWEGADLERTEARAFAFFDAYLKGSDLPLLLAEDFDGGAARWEPTDASAWKTDGTGRNACYSLVKKTSAYTPPHRSPLNIALLKGLEVSDFVLDARVQSTVDDYGHRDLCFFFGYRDPAHYYYVHLARAADDRAHSVFIVNGKDRASIAGERTQGVDWSPGWHRVRVRRDAASGKIEVFFDDLEKAIMTASDRTFPAGRIGVGSFDDTGNFDEIRLRGKQAAGGP
jgi:acetyl esterase/lipase